MFPRIFFDTADDAEETYTSPIVINEAEIRTSEITMTSIDPSVYICWQHGTSFALYRPSLIALPPKQFKCPPEMWIQPAGMMLC